MQNPLIETALGQTFDHIRRNIPRYSDQYPHNGDGMTYVLTDNNHWMTSFWPGELWLAYAMTGDETFRREAERKLASFEYRLVNRIDESHDLGFLYSLSARAQWQMTGDAAARQLGIDAAERLITRFHPKGEYIQAWGAMNDPVEGGRMIVDCLMNLPLLFWASHETGDPKYAEVASKHAQTTLRYLVRDGDTTYHTFFFNQETGEPIGGKTAQGFADDSLWSRGQAWAVYGFALAADWTGDADLLDTACRLAERFWTELGDELVPLWDFRVTPDGPHKRDSSAGAIAACGLFKLATLVKDDSQAATFKKRAEQMTTRLIEACFETSPEAWGLLCDSSYNVPSNRAVEQFMPFGDYYFLESIVTMSGKPVDFWGKASLGDSTYKDDNHMLYPQSNAKRQMTDLSGFWKIQFDPDDIGAFESGFDGGEIIAVPASWNDQFNERRDYLGTAWYQTTFGMPWGWRGQRIFVRFNSVNYLAEVWLNGKRLGDHEGGHLPFAFDITDHVRDEENVLVVRVDGKLAPDRVPPGNLAGQPGISFGRADFPDANFDFFPFCGIQRPVLLYTTPQAAIADVTVTTTINGTDGIVAVKALTLGSNLTTRFTLQGHGADLTVESDTNEASLTVTNAALWSPDAPNLYALQVELLQAGAVVDTYTLDIGIRTITVDGDRLLLNGAPLKLLGFGRHEDFPVVGKGLLPALIVKDYGLMRWIGANSFRTTHYPYSEQMMQLADQLGFMIIDETPAVGLFFTEPGLERRNELCKQYIRELIDRDKNHPSVLMWSIANEPHTARPEARETYYNEDFKVLDHASREAAVSAFQEQAELAHALDPTRPITIVSHEGATEEAWRFVDVISLNRYYGWYSQPGQIDMGVERLSREIDLIHERFPGPFILSEFGTDTIPGQHADPPEMFSEEYQAEFLSQYIAMLDAKPFVVGQHIWNLCDFKTSQGVIRMGAYNYKGLFTRDRRPKLAAFRVRELWARL